MICRLMARDKTGRRRLTLRDIQRRSGLGIGTIRAMSVMASWDHVKVGTMLRFCDGCGIDLLHVRRQMEHLKRRRLIHTRRETRYYKRLLTYATAMMPSTRPALGDASESIS